MFITRATRHDRADIKSLLDLAGRREVDLTEGVVYYAREGSVVGCVRLIELEPRVLVVDDVLVAESHRGGGIGTGLIQAAMNAKGGTMYVACHADTVVFFERFGFGEIDPSGCPEAVRDYWSRAREHPGSEKGSTHFLRAR